MKRLVISIILFIGIITCKGQVKESDKIYWEALDRYTSYLDTADKGESTTLALKRTIYIKKQDFIDSLPKVINGYSITIITSENYKQLYKEHGRRLVHTVIFPIKVMTDRLDISIIPYRGELKRNHLNLGVSDGVTISFIYNCEQKKFLVTKVRGWGI